ncbi:MAG: CoA transferase [Myxococcota bacterium]|jgi:crotonobetainyl-CoA:carnitine CoA-transferase CaiB-like acyl-CoA transferase|nr:CoA transferase [Myxococcota bacterium]
MAGPLSGVRIVDVSEVISGPLATMILADQGADIVKIEPPRYGEESRQLANYREGMAGLYANCNHGKRSIGVDLKNERGLELALELIRGADVFVQNWRPGAAERLGLGEDALRVVNPDIIYASITGYGDDGPYADRRGYDPIFQCLTGYVAAQTNPQIPVPDLVRNAVVDKATSYSLAQGITAALFARERGAGGQHVKVAMLDAGLAFFWPDGMLRHTLMGEGIDHYVVPGERYQLMSTADGQLVVWAGTAEQMRASLLVVGEDELASSPGQRGKPMLEEKNQLARAEAVNAGFGKLSTAEAYRLCIEHELPAAPVLTQEDVFVDPQIVHNGAVIEAEHPIYGRYRRAAPSAKFSSTAFESSLPPALYGEQSDEILEELGYSETARATLRAENVVS